MNAFEGLPEALSALRAKSGLKSGEIAKRADVSAGMLSGYITGRENPNVETLGRVLEAMGATVDDLAAELAKIQGRAPIEIPPSEDELKGRLVRRFGDVVDELFEVIGGQRRQEGGSVEKAAFDAIERVGGRRKPRVRKRKNS